MKLRRTQLVGLLAIVVFGAGLIVRLREPSEREIMEKRLASLPRIETPAPEFPSLNLPPIAPVTAPVTAPALIPGSAGAGAADPFSYPGQPDYLNVGSQAGKDDMYCAGVIRAEFDARPDQPPDDMSRQIEAQTWLEEAGAVKLIADGAATRETSAGFTLAYAARARADRAAGVLRVSFKRCMTRAAAAKAD